MISARNVQGRAVTFDGARFLSDADFALEHARTGVSPGDVLLTIVGTIGRVAVVPAAARPFALQRSVAVLKPRLVESRFLAYALETSDAQHWLASNAKGTAQKGIYLNVLGDLPTPLAPAAEQVRVADQLDEVLSDLGAAVSELELASRKLTQYRQSLLKAAVEGDLTAEWRASDPPQETGAELLARILRERRARWEAAQLERFASLGRKPPADWSSKYPEPTQPELHGLPGLPSTWAWANLDCISEIQGGIQKQPSRTPSQNSFPFLRVANVARGQLKLDSVHEIELFEGELERLRLQRDDVLIVEGNGSLTEIGRCARWDGSIPNAVHQNHLIRARPVLMSGLFVETWINSQSGIRSLTRLAATTSGLYTLSVGKIGRVPIPVPPVDEQEQIGLLLEDSLQQIAQASVSVETGLRMAAAQRQNILRAAFSGQLVPQDPTDEPASVLLDRIRAERAQPLSSRPAQSPQRLRKTTC